MFAHNVQQKETPIGDHPGKPPHPERTRKTGRTSGKSSRCHSRRSSLDILAEEPLIINPHMVMMEDEEESLLDRSFSDEENEESKLSSSYNECQNELSKSFKNHKFSRKEEEDALTSSYMEERLSRQKKISREEGTLVFPRRSRDHSLDDRKSMREDEVRLRKRSHSQLRSTKTSKGSHGGSVASLNGSMNDLDKKESKYPSLPTSRRTSWSGHKAASWSRRSSLAGNEFFKLDDEVL